MKKLVTSLLAIGAAALLSAQDGVHFGIGARGLFGFGLGTTTNAAEKFAIAEYDASIESTRRQMRALGLPVGTFDDWETDWDDMNLKVKPFSSIVAGGALVGRLSFDAVPGLYIQPEVGFYHNQAKYTYSWEYSKTKTKDYGGGYTYRRDSSAEEEGGGSFSYNSIDIPIIVGYDVDLGSGLVLSPYAGLNLSIPIGKLSWSRDAYTYKHSSTTTNYLNGNVTSTYHDDDTIKFFSSSIDGTIKNGVIPGIVLGTGFGYKIDKHSMIMGDLRYLLDFTAVRAETDLKDSSKATAKEWGVSWNWDAEDDKWNESFNFDALTRRALTIGVTYVYYIN